MTYQNAIIDVRKIVIIGAVVATALAAFAVAFSTFPKVALADCPSGDCGFYDVYYDDYDTGGGYYDVYYDDYDTGYYDVYYDDYSYDYSYSYSYDYYDSYDYAYSNYNDYYAYDYNTYWYDYEPYYVDYSYDYYDYGCYYDCYDYPDYGCNYGCNPPEPEPVCTEFEASDYSIEEGDSVTLSWKTRYADSVNLSGYGSVSSNGSRTVSPDNDTTYTLKVTGHGGTDTCTVHIEVEEEDNDDLWCELDVSDNRVEEGDEVTLEWDTRGATYASINQGVGRVDEDGGEEDVEVDRDTTYRLTVRDRDGDEETCTATVRVEDEDDFSSISFTGDPVNNPPTVYLSQLPYTGIEDMSPSLMAAIVMLAGLLGIGGYFFFVKRRTA